MNFTYVADPGTFVLMEITEAILALLPGAVVLAAPLITAFAAFACRPGSSSIACGRLARGSTGLGLVLALFTLIGLFVYGPLTLPWFRVDLVGSMVMLLVAFMGWVIARFSRNYLDGERNQAQYARWLLATLTGAMLVVLANNLLFLAVAWWGTSFALQKLLLFYPDRPAAVMAAHKKLLLSRAADLCMLAACVLLYMQIGSLQIDTLVSHARSGPMSLTVQCAVMLVALTAVLKCAQLPFHGWLIQVMEAPTPVSALLHAGVVNLGGFVLLRLAALVDQVAAAQLLLVLIGATTAVVAALVMSTRISIKVSLAWSTCAQMGFMLMQCGLGLWQMALLHLLAHSLYKAHAFLGAGGIVRETMIAKLVKRAPRASIGQSLLGAAGGLVLVAGAAFLWGVNLSSQPALLVMGAILALALNPLIASSGRGSLLLSWMLAFALAWMYFALHHVFGNWVFPHSSSETILWLIPAIGFAGLFVLQTAVRASANWTQSIYPWIYGGLFLDERVSRLMFRNFSPSPVLKDQT